MDKEKLNSLHALYITCAVECRNQVFSEIYAETKKARDINRSIITQQGYGDESDALALFDNVIWKMVGDGRITDFERTLNARLRKRRIDALRSTTRKRARQCSLDEMVEAMEEGAATPKVLKSGYDLETEVFRTKEADHLQVIDSLVRNGKTDTTTTAIVDAMLNTLGGVSRNEVAKKLGIHHEVIKRKLTALSRRYDESRFGDIRELLAV